MLDGLTSRCTTPWAWAWRKRVADGDADLDDVAVRQPARGQSALQRGAAHELGDQVGALVVGGGLVQGDDPWVRRGGPRRGPRARSGPRRRRSRGRILIATSRCRRSSRAIHTVPKPPRAQPPAQPVAVEHDRGLGRLRKPDRCRASAPSGSAGRARARVTSVRASSVARVRRAAPVVNWPARMWQDSRPGPGPCPAPGRFRRRTVQAFRRARRNTSRTTTRKERAACRSSMRQTSLVQPPDQRRDAAGPRAAADPPHGDPQAIRVRRGVAAAVLVVLFILVVLGVHSCQVSARNSALQDYNANVVAAGAAVKRRPGARSSPC